MKWFNLKKSVLYFFYPSTAIIGCFVSMVVLDIIFIVLLFFSAEGSVAYNVFLALVTGVTASFLVSAVLEMAHNFHQNQRAEIMLQEYYGMIFAYENERNVRMKTHQFQKAMRKMRKFSKRLEDECEDDDDLIQKEDDVQSLWHQLPKILPVARKTKEERAEYLSENEYKLLCTFLSYFETIRQITEMELFPGFVEKIVNEKASDMLDAWLPETMQSEISPEYLRELSQIEMKKAFDKVVDSVFTNEDTMRVAFDEYRIGREYILSDSEFDSRLEQHNNDISLVSSILNQYCVNMLECLEELKQIAKEKPTIGYILGRF